MYSAPGVTASARTARLFSRRRVERTIAPGSSNHRAQSAVGIAEQEQVIERHAAEMRIPRCALPMRCQAMEKNGGGGVDCSGGPRRIRASWSRTRRGPAPRIVSSAHVRTDCRLPSTPRAAHRSTIALRCRIDRWIPGQAVTLH